MALQIKWTSISENSSKTISPAYPSPNPPVSLENIQEIQNQSKTIADPHESAPDASISKTAAWSMNLPRKARAESDCWKESNASVPLPWEK
jgi:hypothetical protein